MRRVDAAVSTWLTRHRDPRRDVVTRLGSVAADSSSAVTMATLTAAALAATGHRRRAAALITAMVGQLLVFLFAAQAVGRARPVVPHLDHDPPTASFPSGHTSASVVLYGTLADLAGRHLPARAADVIRPLCWTVPPLVASARVYRGMHHASDVLAGFGSGLVWLWLTRRAVDQTGPQAGLRIAGSASSAMTIISDTADNARSTPKWSPRKPSTGGPARKAR